MRERIQIEDALKHLHECEYRGQSASAESLAGVMGCDVVESTDLLTKLLASNLVSQSHGAYSLTASGRGYARHVVRAHRLYETYLARIEGVPAELWHRQAERQEHKLSGTDVNELARKLGHPRFDPHGDPIPTRRGDSPALRGFSLLEAPVGWQGRIVHIPDEPPGVFRERSKSPSFPASSIVSPAGVR